MPKLITSTPKVCHFKLNVAKTWYVHFRFFNPNTGRREQYRRTFGLNRYHDKNERLKEAHALVKAIKQKLAEGWLPYPTAEKIEYNSIKDALEKVCDLKWESLRPRTKHTYSVIISLFYKWLSVTGYNDYSPTEFKYIHAQQYMDYLTITRKINGRTWNNHLAFMKIFFNYLVDRELIERNPFRKIKKHLQSKSTRNSAFSETEFTKLNKHLKEKYLRLYYFNMFIYYGALRQKEISMLKVGDIDFVNQNIFIGSEVSKNKKSESVVITKNFMNIIKEMNLEALPKEYYIFSIGCVPGPLYNNTFDKLSVKTKKIIRELEINEACTQYSYKHTAVIRLYHATGHNIHAVSQHCRHYSIVVTQNYLKSLGFVDNSAVRNAVF